MKVGIVTVYDSINSGSYLQALALQEIIKENGDEPYFIKSRSNLNTLSLFLGYNWTSNSKNIKAFIKHYIYMFIHPKLFFNRYRKYKKYKKDWEKFDNIINIKEAEELDVILYGSDEIWNPKKTTFMNPIFYGKHLEKKEKAGYAISVGDAIASDFDNQKELVSLMKKFKTIYVRDSHSKEVLNQLGIHVDGQICDPTLQIDIRSIMNFNGYDTKQKYMAIYSYKFYGEDKQTIELIKRFAKERGLKTVAVSLPQDWCDEYCNCSPLEFGNVLSGAEYVFTSTFHGTIFSSLYHTKFASYSSLPKVIDVLDRLGLSQSRLKSGFTYEDLVSVLEQNKNYCAMEKKLHKSRRESKSAYNSIMHRECTFNGVCEYNNCSGCGACSFVCPRQCISMVENNIGVIYPRIDKKNCINCGKCEDVCPQINNVNSYYPQKAYAAWSKNEEERKTSASGGIAAEIYKTLLDKEYYIVGAKTNDDFSVDLVVSNNDDMIVEFKNSKYVFSNMFSLFNELHNLVKNNKKICMVGMPCQVAAVKNVFSNYNNIIYIDFVCHGFAPYSYLKQHIDSLNVVADKLYFRDPNKDTSKYFFSLYNKSECVYSQRMIQGDSYQIGYHKGINFRENCYSCIYANSKRVGDLTLCDYYGLGNLEPVSFCKNKVSAILVNTEQGSKLLEQLSNNIEKHQRNVQEPINGNNTLRSPIKKSKYRYIFKKIIISNNGDYEKTMSEIIPIIQKEERKGKIKNKIIEKVLIIFKKQFYRQAQ